MDLPTIRSELKSRVAKGLNFGIEGVEDVLDPACALFNDFVLLQSKYNDLMYVSSINTLPYEQVELGLDRLRKSLLDMIDGLDNKSLKKQEVKQGLKIQALPTRRQNFFKLLDIHFQNLEAITYSVYYDGNVPEYTVRGRQAVFELYQSIRRNLRNESEEKKIVAFFENYYRNEVGILEVYFKNVKHLIEYVMDSDIEREFFLETLRSLFSRFELAMILYYALTEGAPTFKSLVLDSQLIDESVKGLLIREEHLAQLSA